MKEGDVCLKDGDWEIRDTPLRKGQFCIFYRANLSGQRMAEAILQREKAYQSTLSWLGNEVPEEVLEVVEPVPDTEKAE